MVCSSPFKIGSSKGQYFCTKECSDCGAHGGVCLCTLRQESKSGGMSGAWRTTAEPGSILRAVSEYGGDITQVLDYYPFGAFRITD